MLLILPSHKFWIIFHLALSTIAIHLKLENIFSISCCVFGKCLSLPQNNKPVTEKFRSDFIGICVFCLNFVIYERERETKLKWDFFSWLKLEYMCRIVWVRRAIKRNWLNTRFIQQFNAATVVFTPAIEIQKIISIFTIKMSLEKNIAFFFFFFLNRISSFSRYECKYPH